MHYKTCLFCNTTIKEYWWRTNLGLAVNVLGEIIRLLTIVTAGQQLVMSRIYRFVQHLDYYDFFIWSISIQIMLYIFSERIPYDQELIGISWGVNSMYIRRKSGFTDRQPLPPM
uniref:Protein-S-isoprenylcysteine O-methyltransferase n=1 Tax=Solanum lycopersicum TaxID=4081 RepID=A0A3Q7EXU5_SOLLC